MIIHSHQVVSETTTTTARCFVLVTVVSWLSPASDPMEKPHGDAESGGCARGFVTSSNPSAWPWQRCCTTRMTGCTPSTALHGARIQPPGPGDGESDETKHTAKIRKTPPLSPPKIKKVRGWVRTRGPNCPRSRAHSRGELMPCPRCPRWTSRNQRRSRSRRLRRTARSRWMRPDVSG